MPKVTVTTRPCKFCYIEEHPLFYLETITKIHLLYYCPRTKKKSYQPFVPKLIIPIIKSKLLSFREDQLKLFDLTPEG